MARIDGNQCGCGRTAFALSEIAVSDPEDKKVSVVLKDVVLGKCFGCGMELLVGRGEWRFAPISPRLPEGKEILADSIKRALYPEPEILPTEVTTE